MITQFKINELKYKVRTLASIFHGYNVVVIDSRHVYVKSCVFTDDLKTLTENNERNLLMSWSLNILLYSFYTVL